MAGTLLVTTGAALAGLTLVLIPVSVCLRVPGVALLGPRGGRLLRVADSLGCVLTTPGVLAPAPTDDVPILADNLLLAAADTRTGVKPGWLNLVPMSRTLPWF